MKQSRDVMGFKRSWLLEPTANWAERVIRTGSLYPAPDVAQPLPASMTEMQSRVFTQSFPYDFWSRLASFMDEADEVMQSLPAQKRYSIDAAAQQVLSGRE